MQKAVESLQQAFAKIRSGRPSPALLEDVRVACYGGETQLKQIANIAVEEGRTLTVTPWDLKLLQDIEKALLKSEVGITPTVTGNILRLPMPPLTQENRKQQVKLARQEAEQARVAVRNIRRDLNNAARTLVKEQALSTDEEKRSQNQTQRLTDDHIHKIDQLLQQKEQEILDFV